MAESYLENAKSDARDTIDHFEDDVVEQIRNSGEASTDLHKDYPDGDSYHHENHVDKAYSLSDAAALLDELNDHKETDSGLWEGQAPRDAISTQAAFTYGSAVLYFFREYIEELNDDFDGFTDLGDTDAQNDRAEGFARLWIYLVCYRNVDEIVTPKSKMEALEQEALEGLKKHDLTGCLMLADVLQEEGNHNAKRFLAAYDMAMTPDEEEADEEEVSETA